LIVLTEGEIVWDSTAVDFDWNKTNALPENLAKAFAEEPLYLDFRWAKTAEEVSLNNPRFLDQIAALASPLMDVRRKISLAKMSSNTGGRSDGPGRPASCFSS
jgi:hypothetical protein